MRLSRMSRGWIWLVGGFLALTAPLHAVQASAVAVDRLQIDAAALTLDITGARTTTYTFSRTIEPPAEIVMGAYQDPIVEMSNGFLTAKIYSTGADGAWPPGGSVDTVAGTMSVDFSSLRVSAQTIFGTLDTAVPVIATTPSSGTYDPLTREYFLWWSNPFSVVVDGSTLTGTATVGLTGTATLVPVPAAVWLLGSGLVGLAGIARRRRA